MLTAELNKYRVDSSDLDAVATAQISNLRSFDMVFSVWLYESKRGEPFYQLAPRLWPCKALKQFLEHQPSSKNLICSLKSVLQRLDFGYCSLGVSAEGERPDAGINE